MVVSIDPIYTFTPTEETLITVQLTNAFGCITADTVRIIIDCIPKVFGPNAFKPTGVNKDFFLVTKFLIDFEIFIYSKWGELVFQSENELFRWDGTLNGELLPAGTYPYVVKFKSEFSTDQSIKEKRGGVVLLR